MELSAEQQFLIQWETERQKMLKQFSLTQLASDLGVSLNTVRNRLWRIRKEMKREL